MPRSPLTLSILRRHQRRSRRRGRRTSKSSPPSSTVPSMHVDVLEKIFSHLPISVLVHLRAVSKYFRSSISTLRGPFRRDPFFFLFYSFVSDGAMVYQPYRDLWRTRCVDRFPTASFGSQLVITNFSLFNPSPRFVWTRTMTNVYLYDPFANATTVIPRPEFPWSFGVALSVSDNGNCKVVTLTNFPSHFQVYDRHQDSWTSGFVPDYMNFFENAVPFNGFLYILIHFPDTLVRFNLEADPWESTVCETPSQLCVHLLTFDGRLFLVGGAEEDLPIVSLGIWEFVPGPEDMFEWRWVAAMPIEFSPEFLEGGLLTSFKVCSGAGFICFYHLTTHMVLLCDMVDWRWRWASDCPVPTHQRDVWLGCAVEPSANLLK